MKTVLLIALIIFYSTDSFAGEQVRRFWRDANESTLRLTGNRQIIPAKYRTVQIDFNQAVNSLRALPLESEVIAGRREMFEMELPSPSGKTERFKVCEVPIMEPGLAVQYSDIRTYNGQGIDNPASTVRFDFTPKGFHAMVLSSDGSWFIDPYFAEGTEYYISYYKSDFYASLTGERALECTVMSDEDVADEIRYFAQTRGIKAGEQMRTYRLALAATGEYTTFHGGTVAAGLAAIVTAMNRVNGVYEKEVSLRMILVANTNLVIYTNSGTDPYTNNNGSTMLSQNQTTLDNIIGTANYDIGHVFSTGGGGIAGLGVVCKSSNKAWGVTGLTSPIGDPFYIDYVAHEMGHQWGGNHSFNGSTGSCSGSNRNASTAYEPGSGSTIMAYAGICSPQDLQSNSDAYFHGVNLDEIIAYSTTGYGNNCAVTTATGNNPPSVTVPAGGFTIPVSTPFELTGSATDPNNDTLTYCWEEFDLGSAGAPGSPVGQAPIFRSFNPITLPTRIFPKLTNLLNNTTAIGEIMPTYTRTLTFRLAARDNKSVGGGTGKATMTFSVSSAAGPFTVTYPNTSVSVNGNSAQTITWNVANTNLSPVSVSNVKILLSTNGGLTFPVTVSESTPNDGSEEIVMPNIATTQARIKVAAVGNVFFYLSNANFIIVDNPIPVELSSFTAVSENGVVKLYWETATETNNKGFSIERLDAAKVSGNNTSSGEWKNIGFVPGKGTTTEKQKYTFADEYTAAGIYKYRLVQTDLDGRINFSKSVEIELQNEMDFSLEQNYPNPFNPATVIFYQVPSESRVTIKVFDVLGNQIALLVNDQMAAGKYRVEFNASKLSGGIYYYEMNAVSSTSPGAIKLVKKMTLVK